MRVTINLPIINWVLDPIKMPPEQVADIKEKILASQPGEELEIRLEFIFGQTRPDITVNDLKEINSLVDRLKEKLK